MNRNDFTGFITGNKVPGESEVSGVREMTTLFPWFHSAHLVLLKTLIENSDIKFETQLRKSALYVADRSILYNYLYLTLPSKREEEVQTEESNTVALNEAIVVHLDEHPSDSISVVAADSQLSSDDEAILSDSSKNMGVIAEPEIQAVVPEAVPSGDTKSDESHIKIQTEEAHIEVVTRSREELIAEIEARLRDLTNATETLTAGVNESGPGSIGSNPEKTESSEIDVEEVTSRIFEDNEVAEEDPLMDIEYYDNGSDEETEVQSISENRIDDSDDLLELDATEKPADFHVAEGDTIVIDTPQPQADEYIIDISELKHDSESEKHTITQADLIDKFIQTSPRLDRMTPGGEHPVVDLSEQSAKEEVPFITETIAKIYVNQGYYSKAINIYEKLTLQFPEKSAYFASRIEKIKGLIK